MQNQRSQKNCSRIALALALENKCANHSVNFWTMQIFLVEIFCLTLHTIKSKGIFLCKKTKWNFPVQKNQREFPYVDK
jgi:hypothetical protein